MALEHRRAIDDYLDALNAIMYTRDRDGNYQFVNKRFVEASPYTEEQILGKNDHTLWPRRADDYRHNDEVVWRTKQPFTYQETGEIDGGTHTYLICKFPIFKNGEMTAVGGFAVDISESVEELQEVLGLVGRLMTSLDQSQNMLRALQFVLPQ